MANCCVTVRSSSLPSFAPAFSIHCHVPFSFSFRTYLASSLFLLCSCGSIAAQPMGQTSCVFFFFRTTHLFYICHLPSVTPSLSPPDALCRSDHLENLDPASFAPAGLRALICCRDNGFSADLHLCYESSGSCLLTGKLQSV